MKRIRSTAAVLLVILAIAGSFSAWAAELPELHAKALEKHAQNADTVGWLQVPGTRIDDVVLQYTGDSNQYYLRRGFDGSNDMNGSLFADYRCDFPGTGSAGLSMNTVIYGNSMSDDPEGAGLSGIKYYQYDDFAAENPYIYFATTNETFAWEVFAVAVVQIDLPYNRPDLDPDAILDAVDTLRAGNIHSHLDGITVDAQDKILTLSTPDYSITSSYPSDYRFVVMAKLVDDTQDEAASPNENPGTGRPC